MTGLSEILTSEYNERYHAYIPGLKTSIQDIVLSHQIKESWNIHDNHMSFSGKFYSSKKQIGVLSACFEDDTLSFHTCRFKALDGSIGREIIARAILLANELSESYGFSFDKLYKYYTLSHNDLTIEDWGGKKYQEYREQQDLKYDVIFRGLGFNDCSPKNQGNRNYVLMPDLHPMEVRIENAISLIKKSWKNLFYEKRIKKAGLDWNKVAPTLDWQSIKQQWHKNYIDSRTELREKGIYININGMPVNLSA